MSESRYTAQKFIEAIPGTGGVVSRLAERVGCDWHTARKYIDTYVTVKKAWEAERNRVTDVARCNIVNAIEEGDLQMSKWWMQVMDDDFTPRQKQEISGDVKLIHVQDLTDDQLAAIAARGS